MGRMLLSTCAAISVLLSRLGKLLWIRRYAAGFARQVLALANTLRDGLDELRCFGNTQSILADPLANPVSAYLSLAGGVVVILVDYAGSGWKFADRESPGAKAIQSSGEGFHMSDFPGHKKLKRFFAARIVG